MSRINLVDVVNVETDRVVEINVDKIEAIYHLCDNVYSIIYGGDESQYVQVDNDDYKKVKDRIREINGKY